MKAFTLIVRTRSPAECEHADEQLDYAAVGWSASRTRKTRKQLSYQTL